MAYSSLLFLILLLLLPLIFHLKKRKAIRTKKNHPPGPPGLPIIGNLHQLGELRHRTFSQFSKKYGDVMLINLGYLPTVIVSSPEAAKEILKTHDLKTCSRPLFTGTGRLSYNYLDFAFTPYGNYWRDIRKLCVLEMLSLKRVESFRFIREEEVSLLVDSISRLCSCSSPVDLSEKIMYLTCNVTCRVAFGKSFRDRGFNNERFQEVVHEGMTMLGAFFAADFFPYVGWIFDRVRGLHSRLEKNFQDFDEFYQKVIDDHIKKGRNSGEDEDLIDVLLELERSQTESADGIQFSKDHIKAILMNIFLAGVDTGATALVWAMAELVKNPRVMKKVQEEIRNNIGSRGKVSESDTNKLGYLKMVLKETLRFRPPGALLIPRETMSEFSINGYEIYPKTRIEINAWAIGRDPKVWKNPEEFYPERFMDNHPIEYNQQNSYEMLPFGGGRRGCPGASMAMKLVELTLANLLFCFDWKLPYDMKIEDLNMEEAFSGSIYKKEPLVLVPIRH